MKRPISGLQRGQRVRVVDAGPDTGLLPAKRFFGKEVTIQRAGPSRGSVPAFYSFDFGGRVMAISPAWLERLEGGE